MTPGTNQPKRTLFFIDTTVAESLLEPVPRIATQSDVVKKLSRLTQVYLDDPDIDVLDAQHHYRGFIETEIEYNHVKQAVDVLVDQVHRTLGTTPYDPVVKNFLTGAYYQGRWKMAVYNIHEPVNAIPIV